MHWKNHRAITTALLALGLFTACEKVFMPRDAEPTATATFDYLWQQIDERYSLFDVKDGTPYATRCGPECTTV